VLKVWRENLNLERERRGKTNGYRGHTIENLETQAAPLHRGAMAIPAMLVIAAFVGRTTCTRRLKDSGATSTCQ